MSFLRKLCAFSYLLFLFSCQNSNPSEGVTPEDPSSDFYNAVDISYYPRIVQKGLTFYNRQDVVKDFLQILKENNINTIRLRLWHQPVDEHASFEEVKTFSAQLKAQGFKVWITVHYSDTWADPAHQMIPAAWQGLSFAQMKDSVYNYTKKIVSQIDPNIIQIGNEIDSGFLLPTGDINTQRDQFLMLLEEGIQSVRDHAPETKIMLHKADPNTADWFYDVVRNLDYDLIGVSYYPRWHGKDLNLLRSRLQNLENTFQKDILIAETSYPFTLDWNDFTNNNIGSNDQIIFPQYPASFEGQKDFLAEIKSLVRSLDKGVGLGYWGAEWVAFEGPTATNGSSWENQALFDFNLKATPALEVFKDE